MSSSGTWGKRMVYVFRHFSTSDKLTNDRLRDLSCASCSPSKPSTGAAL